jgi:hypothetical protein
MHLRVRFLSYLTTESEEIPLHQYPQVISFTGHVS